MTRPKYLSVGQAAEALGLPGPWTLRRLERHGVVPEAPRGRVTGHRYYSADDVERMALAIARRRLEVAA